jgi:mobilization protein NikA
VLANPTNFLGEGERTEMRVRTASTKVTEAEFAELDAFASQRGQSVSEWIRQTILAEARSQRNTATTSHLFTELVGIQLLLINTLGPLIRGERMTADHLNAILRQVQSTKARKAHELLAKRLNAEERIG